MEHPKFSALKSILSNGICEGINLTNDGIISSSILNALCNTLADKIIEEMEGK